MDKLVELSQRPFCRFPESTFEPGYLNRQLSSLIDLLRADARLLVDAGELDAALERYLTLWRIHRHRLRGQPLSSMARFLTMVTYRPHGLLSSPFAEWATHPDQTSQRLRAAIARLEKCPATLATPWDAILAERQRIRAVVLGSEPPSFLSQEHPLWSGHLAFLANRLPWERQRALAALDLKTKQTLSYLTGAMHRVGNPSDYYAKQLRQLVRQAPRRGAPEPNPDLYLDMTGSPGPWKKFAHATESSCQASTSYLVTQELNSRFHFHDLLHWYVESEIDCRGLKLLLALLAYRLDHDAYPKTLAELVPEQIEKLPLDPYSGEAFPYRPHGFELPLNARQHVPAKTPLFWSVGCGNRGLYEETVRSASQDDERETSRPQQVLMFRSTARNGYDSDHGSLVFPLPK